MDKQAQILKTHGIKPSLTRMLILSYLSEATTHPTVEEIYNALVSTIPTLSKTTVYNTLHLFTQNNLARAVMLKDQETRYDLATHPHAHFQCRICNTVFDTDILPKLSVANELSMHHIEEVSVLFTGICEGCKDKSN